MNTLQSIRPHPRQIATLAVVALLGCRHPATGAANRVPVETTVSATLLAPDQMGSVESVSDDTSTSGELTTIGPASPGVVLPNK